MNPLKFYGLFALTAMLISYAFEKRSPWFILAFAASCVLAAGVRFLQGAWPFGMQAITTAKIVIAQRGPSAGGVTGERVTPR